MKNYSFEEWSLIYRPEIESIIDEYTAFIMDCFTSENKVHSLNILQFSEQMRRLIYTTSVNKEKNNILYL